MKKNSMIVAVSLAATVFLAGCTAGPLNVDESVLSPTPTVSSSSAKANTTPTAKPSATKTATPKPTATVETDDGTIELLNTLAVKGKAPDTGYERSEFGSAWKDVDENGCDTRNDILSRDMVDSTQIDGCEVVEGVLADRFSGENIEFTKDGNGGGVDIDHLVALKEAWVKGAQQISKEQRTAFANDPENLWAVDAGLNRQKGDKDAATWLPPHKAARCDYVSQQVKVKAKYGLWVTQPEKDAIVRVLEKC